MKIIPEHKPIKPRGKISIQHTCRREENVICYLKGVAHTALALFPQSEHRPRGGRTSGERGLHPPALGEPSRGRERAAGPSLSDPQDPRLPHRPGGSCWPLCPRSPRAFMWPPLQLANGSLFSLSRLLVAAEDHMWVTGGPQPRRPCARAGLLRSSPPVEASPCPSLVEGGGGQGHTCANTRATQLYRLGRGAGVWQGGAVGSLERPCPLCPPLVPTSG